MTKLVSWWIGVLTMILLASAASGQLPGPSCGSARTFGEAIILESGPGLLNELQSEILQPASPKIGALVEPPRQWVSEDCSVYLGWPCLVWACKCENQCENRCGVNQVNCNSRTCVCNC